MQCQQIAITTYDMLCTTADCQFQEFIVFGVSTCGHDLSNLDKYSFLQKCDQELKAFFLAHIFVELLSSEDIVQLIHNIQRNQYLPCC